ncbi:hypothetical protein [Isoptericola aurantiacus]|uniref:hypothetical protein n=1 Tax=Isoptericola aurantiacus TaxID=3377839 RepID=UPI00383B6222
MDLSNTIHPDSDQLDAVDLAAGPRTFTIAAVRQGNAEQPVQVDLAEFPRPWRPGKSMRRVLVALWGADGSQYVGRRVRLYCDERVQFGGMAVGGTRVAAMSHIGGKKRSVPLLVSRGKSAMFTVEPLPDDVEPTAPEPTADEVAEITDRDELRRIWQAASPEIRALVEARNAELKAADGATGGEES